MTHVLLVEDSLDRVQWFATALDRLGRPYDVTHDPDTAIRWLAEGRVYADLYLDHDLGHEPRAGRDVATWLIAHPAVLPMLMITTHTVNTVSGPKIERELLDAGRFARWLPFTQLVAESPGWSRMGGINGWLNLHV